MSNPSSVETFLISAIATVCNLEPASVALDADVADLGLDSLNLTAVIGLIESQFGCEVDPDRMIDFFEAASVGDLATLTRRMIAASGLAGTEDAAVGGAAQ